MLWCRPAGTVLIRPLAWESPYTMGAALKKKVALMDRQREEHSRLVPPRTMPPLGRGREESSSVRGAWRDQLVDIVLIGGW